MDEARGNPWGITRTGYATDMTDDGPLEYELEQAGKNFEKTYLRMGSLFADAASIVTYARSAGGPVSVLVIPFVGADSWCEEYYVMSGVSHADALAIDWSRIVDDVRDLNRGGG